MYIKDTTKGNVFLNYSYETRSVPLYFEDTKAAIRLADEHTHITVSVKQLGVPKTSAFSLPFYSLPEPLNHSIF